MYKFGFVDYFNSLPLSSGFKHPELQSVFAIPAQISDCLLSGSIDVGLIPVYDFLKNKEQLALFGNLCISAKNNKIQSVLLFSKNPIEQLSDQIVYLTNHSRTSVQLLKILIERKCNRNVSYQTCPISSDQLLNGEFANMLLIGNDALKAKKLFENGNLTGYYCYDLAELWFELTGLPFVFAVFAINSKSLLEHKLDLKKLIQRQMETTLQNNLSNLFSLAETHQSKFLNSKELMEYFGSIAYMLDERREKSINIFAEYSELTS